jgi:hypothetical protein
MNSKMITSDINKRGSGSKMGRDSVTFLQCFQVRWIWVHVFQSSNSSTLTNQNKKGGWNNNKYFHVFLLESRVTVVWNYILLMPLLMTWVEVQWIKKLKI